MGDKGENSGSVMLWGAFIFAETLWVYLEWSITANQEKFLRADHLHLMKKYFYPDPSGLFTNDIIAPPTDSSWFDKDENDVNYMLWPAQSADLNPIEDL